MRVKQQPQPMLHFIENNDKDEMKLISILKPQKLNFHSIENEQKTKQKRCQLFNSH